MCTFAFMPGASLAPLEFMILIFTGMYWSVFCGLVGSVSGLGKKENFPAVELWISETCPVMVIPGNERDLRSVFQPARPL